MKRKVAVYIYSTRKQKWSHKYSSLFEFIHTDGAASLCAPAAQKLREKVTRACTQSRKCCLAMLTHTMISLGAVCIHSQVHVCAFGLFTFAHVQKQKGCSGIKNAREFTACICRSKDNCELFARTQAAGSLSLSLSLLSPSHQCKRAHIQQ
jgi:hypothetical protein